MKLQGTKAQGLKLEGVLLPGFATGNHRHRQPDLQGIAVGNSVDTDLVFGFSGIMFFHTIRLRVNI